MRIRALVIPAITVGLGVSALTGCSQENEQDPTPSGAFKPNYAVMAQCQNGKMVLVKKIDDGQEKSEAPMTTSHEGAQCSQVITPGKGSRYVSATLSNDKNKVFFYSGLRFPGKPAESMLPLSSGEYMVIIVQLPGTPGGQTANPDNPEDISRLKLFKQMEKAAIGRIDGNKADSPSQFWPTYGLLWQCQDGKMQPIASTGNPPSNPQRHKANPAASGKACKTFGPLAKSTPVMAGHLDAHDDLAVSGIYKSDGKLHSPGDKALKSGEYLIMLAQELGHEGDTPVLTDPAISAGHSFNNHPLVKPLVKAAPPLRPTSKA